MAMQKGGYQQGGKVNRYPKGKYGSKARLAAQKCHIKILGIYISLKTSEINIKKRVTWKLIHITLFSEKLYFFF